MLYLNKDWKEEYGGYLELWNQDMSDRGRKVLPVFNRCVIFSTTDTSYHGHPDPLSCPEGWTRKSMALYYYTAKRPEEEQSNPHGTIFKNRPGEELKIKKPKASKGTVGFAKRVLKQVLPPIIVDTAHQFRKKVDSG